MSWLTEAVARGKNLAQQDKIDKEDEQKRAAEQSLLAAEQKLLERERKYAPWLQEVNTLLEGFNTQEMVDLGYYFEPIEWGIVNNDDRMVSEDASMIVDIELGRYHENWGYTFSAGKGEKRLGKLKCGLYFLSRDRKKLFFSGTPEDHHLDIGYGVMVGTFKKPAEFAAFLKNLLVIWVAEVERSVA